MSPGFHNCRVEERPNLNNRDSLFFNKSNFFVFPSTGKTNFFGNGTIQPKLEIGKPDDEYEKEADQVADAVMRISEPMAHGQSNGNKSIQRKCKECEEKEKKKLQRKEEKGSISPGSLSLVNEVLNSSSGKPLDPGVSAFMEHRFGYDFSNVRIHDDARSHQSSAGINALAYTHDDNVVFGANQYQPHTERGKKLLAHELTHVMQQKKSKSSVLQRRVTPSNVSCNRYPRTYPIFKAIGTEQPVRDLQAVDDRAIELLTNTINELETARTAIQNGEPIAWPAIGDCIAESLRIRLLIDPANRTSWTGNGPRTVGRVIKMLSNLRNVLQGPYLRYECLSHDCEGPGDDAFVDPGVYLVHLCRGFWHYNKDYRAIVLIHELAHIYYNTEDWGYVGLGSSYCIERFIDDVNNIHVPSDYQSACRGNINSCE